MEYIRVCFTLVVYLTCKDSASFAPWQGVGGGRGGIVHKETKHQRPEAFQHFTLSAF